MRPWMEREGFWQLDLYRVMINEFDVEKPQDFLSMDKDTYGELTHRAKQQGLMAQKVKYLDAVYHGKTAANVEKRKAAARKKKDEKLENQFQERKAARQS